MKKNITLEDVLQQYGGRTYVPLAEIHEPLLGISTLTEANRAARDGKLGLDAFKFRESNAAPYMIPVESIYRKMAGGVR